MIQLTLSEIAGLIGGRLIGNPATLITGSVETDSRLVSDGSLFFAKPGEVEPVWEHLLRWASFVLTRAHR